MDPARLEEPGVVGGKARGLLAGVRHGQQPRLDQGLEAVADAQHGPAQAHEIAQLLDMELELAGEYTARAQVVAIGIAAGQDQDVVIHEPRAAGAE